VARGLADADGVGDTDADGLAAGVVAAEVGVPDDEEPPEPLVKTAITPISATMTLSPAIARVRTVFWPVGVADATESPSPYAVGEPGYMIACRHCDTAIRGQ
jgi:hypothetical protein